MKKITQLSMNGWSFDQWAYAIKWHKDTLGKSTDLNEIKSKWDEMNTVQPSTIQEVFDTESAAKVFKAWLGDNLTGASNLIIEMKGNEHE